MREIKVFKVILGIDKGGDICSGCLDLQLSSKYFCNGFLPFFQNRKQMGCKFLFKALWKQSAYNLLIEIFAWPVIAIIQKWNSDKNTTSKISRNNTNWNLLKQFLTYESNVCYSHAVQELSCLLPTGYVTFTTLTVANKDK